MQIKNVNVSVMEQIFNAIELSSIVVVLVLAFAFQLILNELPCPLCLLQRVGFIGVAFGFLLNFRFGLRPSHYAIVILSALFTAFVALRQIALHIVPGTGVYGNAVLGLHLYSWSFLISMLIIIATTLMMSVDRQYVMPSRNNNRWHYCTNCLFAVVFALVVFNLASVILECGSKECPDNPIKYELLK